MTIPITGPLAPSSEITVTRDEVAELGRLFAIVEDWLLGCDGIVLDDLESFLPSTDGPGRVRQFVDDLGNAGVHLARLLRSAPAEHTAGGIR